MVISSGPGKGPFLQPSATLLTLGVTNRTIDIALVPLGKCALTDHQILRKILRRK